MENRNKQQSRLEDTLKYPSDCRLLRSLLLYFSVSYWNGLQFTGLVDNTVS